MASLRRGDIAAFETLYERHSAELLAFGIYMLGSRQDAEDAVQAAFASAYRALRADKRSVVLRPWLFTIARNECLSILRRRRPVVELSGEIAQPEDPLEQLEMREEIRRVFQGLRELPERQRAALVLAEVNGLSQREISRVLSVRVEQVKAYIYQARAALISEKRAREADCREIREELSSARGAALLKGRLRRHVRSCEECRTYADGVARTRRQLGALLPVPALILRYRAIEEVLGIGATDPATYAGTATVGAGVAGVTAEFAGGGLNALLIKVAAGVAALGASAGVGVSVLGSPVGAEPTASTASARSTQSALIVARSSSQPDGQAGGIPTGGQPLAVGGQDGAAPGATAPGPGQAGGDGLELRNAQSGTPTVSTTVGPAGEPGAARDSERTGAAHTERPPKGSGASAHGEERQTAERERQQHREESRRAAEARQRERSERAPKTGPKTEEEREQQREEHKKAREETGPKISSGVPKSEEERQQQHEKEKKAREEREAREAGEEPSG
ncbi:MAG: sigma-70 family RNA polymerase sigma factor [Solirubrobacteraceae bacterium]